MADDARHGGASASADARGEHGLDAKCGAVRRVAAASVGVAAGRGGRAVRRGCAAGVVPGACTAAGVVVSERVVVRGEAEARLPAKPRRARGAVASAARRWQGACHVRAPVGPRPGPGLTPPKL
jgi:hypothetical protein